MHPSSGTTFEGSGIDTRACWWWFENIWKSGYAPSSSSQPLVKRIWAQDTRPWIRDRTQSLFLYKEGFGIGRRACWWCFEKRSVNRDMLLQIQFNCWPKEQFDHRAEFHESMTELVQYSYTKKGLALKQRLVDDGLRKVCKSGCVASNSIHHRSKKN